MAYQNSDPVGSALASSFCFRGSRASVCMQPAQSRVSAWRVLCTPSYRTPVRTARAQKKSKHARRQRDCDQVLAAGHRGSRSYCISCQAYISYSTPSAAFGRSFRSPVLQQSQRCVRGARTPKCRSEICTIALLGICSEIYTGRRMRCVQYG
jgi:hypothetical protein